ncbi:hypothetical protein SK224_08060 [Microbacterium sp. BG28]|uniref:hypothetical protein n=1 Tax=Microbacterium sp. BG28 TaxID=3097356 RepID=UPI002A5A81AD|nr:hypothetical protein [Microbacterium sp. BG28]MDY0829081.1 hypothetical protein [Microbacterium sp. BG28]
MPETADEWIADLESHGYTRLDEWKGMRAGARVRHIGQRYAEASDRGTANVVAILRNSGSSWERDYESPDVEIVVERDKAGPTTWANYHTVLVEIQEPIQA